MKLSDLPLAVQERIKRDNPEVFCRVPSRLAAAGTQRSEVQALDGSKRQQRQSKTGVAVRVIIIALRKRRLDDDSAPFAVKPVRDAIAASLGIDDADSRVAWEYGQVETRGRPGVVVRIERV